jgi:predicted N-acyltransferase
MRPSSPLDAKLNVRVAGRIASIDRAAWDRCANPPRLSAVAGGERFNPFLCHDFLESLECASAVGGRSGWTPAHLVVEDSAGEIIGCVPAYLKSHSMGEYVFDHGWADAFEQAGGRYYPKLQVSIPFTPVTGRRLLVAEGTHEAAAKATLIEALRALRDKVGASSVHVTFLDPDQCEAMCAEGYLKRTGQQFHFLNPGYGQFEDFLNALASRKRKMIRKERAQAIAPGIDIVRLTGGDITEAHWDAFFAFYMDTGARKWGRPYLTREFFSEIGSRMADRILLVMARRNGRWIAGAINFIGDDALYGRNWGAIEEHPMLHFEVCYYQAIEFAIERGLMRVEAGAQGEHKLARGYGPVVTYSVHDFADRRFQRAVADYLEREQLHVAEAAGIYAEHLPFRRASNQDVDPD